MDNYVKLTIKEAFAIFSVGAFIVVPFNVGVCAIIHKLERSPSREYKRLVAPTAELSISTHLQSNDTARGTKRLAREVVGSPTQFPS